MCSRVARLYFLITSIIFSAVTISKVSSSYFILNTYMFYDVIRLCYSVFKVPRFVSAFSCVCILWSTGSVTCVRKCARGVYVDNFIVTLLMFLSNGRGYK